MERGLLRRIVVYLLLGAAVGSLAWISAAASGMLRGQISPVYVPWSLPLGVLQLAGGPPAVVPLLPPLLYLLWTFPVLMNRDRIPRTSIVIFVLLLLLSVWEYGAGWTYANNVRFLPVSAYFVLSVSMMSVALAVAVWGRRHPSLFARLLSHWLAVAWLVSYGFPWLGELP